MCKHTFVVILRTGPPSFYHPKQQKADKRCICWPENTRFAWLHRVSAELSCCDRTNVPKKVQTRLQENICALRALNTSQIFHATLKMVKSDAVPFSSFTRFCSLGQKPAELPSHSMSWHTEWDRKQRMRQEMRGCVGTSVSRSLRRRLSLESSLFCSLSRSRSRRSLDTFIAWRRSVASEFAFNAYRRQPINEEVLKSGLLQSNLILFQKYA